ncbi:DNA polymerase IV [Marinilongibacter aquaticus]|uniref:DNA polymerase Y family protein n=1 Tax=Marinilongibacter aquaticus TaxID=2975157 RepID=UPI0021BD2D34|nr:DNA polymerase IV [Marinilongibacter aquaticus]UBM60382.1 DNA polymerase IV [Marinilongibacter aquaticus]
MDRTILHMDLDTFFVSVERKLDSRLIGKPILIGGTGDRGVVSAASYEARPRVQSGMPMKLARMLCPEAIVIKGNAGVYTDHSRIVTEIIKARVPILEKASVDEFYADLSGMDKHFGCAKYASELREIVKKESGLPISFGLSINKTVAKVATSEMKSKRQTQGSDEGLLNVERGQEKPFLAPLAVKKIPMVGDKTYQTLCNLGIKWVKNVQELPLEVISSVLGKNGHTLWEKANAIDYSPVIEYHERKSISNERTFGKDTTDMHKLRTTIEAMAEQLCFQLRSGGKIASCISVRIRYSDFQTTSKQTKIAYSSADHIMIPKVLELFESLYNRRLLVRLVGVKFSDITNGSYQINLFEDSRKTADLYAGMDKVRNKYGSRAIMRASTFGAKTIGGMMNPFNGEPPIVLAHRTG